MKHKLEHNCMFLNGHGDLNVAWGKEDHEDMKNVILKKMNEGYVFFVVESKFLGLIKNKKKLNKNNFGKLINKKEIIVKDEDLDIFLKKSKEATIGSGSSDSEYQVKSTLNKENIVNNDTFKENTTLVATKPPIAG